MTAGEVDERRVRWLLRCYPAAWRQRYGEEFAELLRADIAERAHLRWRSADIIRCGLAARLSAIGLGAGPVLSPSGAFATVAAATAGFVALGLSLWAQHIGGSMTAAAPLDVVLIALMTLALLAAAVAVERVRLMAKPTER